MRDFNQTDRAVRSPQFAHPLARFFSEIDRLFDRRGVNSDVVTGLNTTAERDVTGKYPDYGFVFAADQANESIVSLGWNRRGGSILSAVATDAEEIKFRTYTAFEKLQGLVGNFNPGDMAFNGFSQPKRPLFVPQALNESRPSDIIRGLEYFRWKATFPESCKLAKEFVPQEADRYFREVEMKQPWILKALGTKAKIEREAVNPYFQALKPYSFSPSVAEHNDATVHADNPTKNISSGWKFHLTVMPKHVVAVADYLKGKGYNHKYLSGGDPLEGKAFTVYIGSFALAQSEGQTIARDLRENLCRPIVEDEVEFAPGVAGRFDIHYFPNYDCCSYLGTDLKQQAVLLNFQSYGSCGIPWLSHVHHPNGKEYYEEEGMYAALRLFGKYFFE